jgi:uncharacterized protein YpuA (DUF1002 family)
MQPLSQQLSQLSAEAKKAEDRFAKAQSQAKEHLTEQREHVRQETEAALQKVSQNLSRAGADAQERTTQLKSKVDSDFGQIKDRADQSKHKFEAWQANNYADDKQADAEAAISYAIVSVKMAELATLDAVEARGRAEIKAEETQPIQA